MIVTKQLLSIILATVYVPIEARPPFREQKSHANVYNKMESLSNQNDISKIFLVFVVCPFAGVTNWGVSVSGANITQQ